MDEFGETAVNCLYMDLMFSYFAMHDGLMASKAVD